MTAEEYRNYLETDFDDVDLKELKDIRKIRIDRNQTKEKRIAQYLRQVGNPYLVCIGNVKVKIRFANNGVSFEDAFEELLLSVLIWRRGTQDSSFISGQNRLTLWVLPMLMER